MKKKSDRYLKIVEWFEEDGDLLPPETAKKDYSGKFNLRVGRDLHKQLTIAALRKGTSLNQFCVESLKKEIGL